MKLKNIYLVSMALLAGVFTACNDDDIENFDNQVYISAEEKTSTVLLKNTIHTAEGSFQIAMARPAEQDLTITVKADPSLVSTYNAAYYDVAENLPEGYYSLNTPQTTILEGAVLSDNITVSFKNLTELNPDKVYVLPVTIDQSNVGVLQSASTMYYVLKGAALINVVPDMTKNLLWVNWTKPEVVNDLRQLTVEALVHPFKLDKEISTVLGIEGKFLLRFGDNAPAKNCLQIVCKPASTEYKINSADLSVSTKVWTHIAVTYDADAKKVVAYLNGAHILEADADWGTLNLGQTQTDEGNGFWIGHSYNRARWFEGNMSEIRLWNKALTQEEINAKDHFYQVEPDADGLVSYWKLDEGAGTTIHDYTGNENHATAVEPLTWNKVELPAK